MNAIRQLSCAILTFTIVVMITTVRAAGKDDFLVVSGKAVNIKGKTIKEYTVKVYEANNLLQTVNYSISFKLILKENTEYTLEIVKDGFYPKRVSIDTRIQREKEKHEKYLLSFEATLYPKKKGSNEYYYDFPSALVKYSALQNIFVINHKYIEHIKENILRDQHQLTSQIN